MSSEIVGTPETACDSLHLWHQAVATLAAVVLVLCAARLADRKRVAAAMECAVSRVCPLSQTQKLHFLHSS